MKIAVEYIELLVAVTYLLFSTKKEDHISYYAFLGMILCLSVDLFVFKGEKPVWVWVILNIPFLVYIYEKILRKYLLVLCKKSIAILSLLVD